MVNDKYEGYLDETTDSEVSDTSITRLQGKTKGERATQLGLSIEREKETNGFGMGVMSDGTPYLNQQGLARLCGVDPQNIGNISKEWGSDKPRYKKIAEIIGDDVPSNPYRSVPYKGTIHHCFPVNICLAILEYYTFDSSSPSSVARQNYRRLAGTKLAELIYREVGYDPSGRHSPRFEKWHERIALNHQSAPIGYFNVFNESSSIIYELIMEGITVDDKTVIDISIGKRWSDHWVSSDFDKTYGLRRHFPHKYPKSHPQSAANPQEAWCYPEIALGEFRRWLAAVYISDGYLRKYLEGKIKRNALPLSIARLAIANIENKALPPGNQVP